MDGFESVYKSQSDLEPGDDCKVLVVIVWVCDYMKI